METMIVGLMVVGAIVAVSTLNTPVSQTEGYKVSQERIVQDALDSMLAQPALDSSRALFGSLLEEYILKAVAGEPAPLMSYLNRTLPSGAQYNVFLDNGFGRPLPVIESGRPVGEAVAGSSTFVPRLAYVFMTPEYGVYQDDFHMNVLAIPMHNSILQRDEGASVELAVTLVGENGQPITLYTYGHTALRMNDPEARSWPGLSMYVKGPAGMPGCAPGTFSTGFCPTHYVDAKNTPLYGGLLSALTLGGDYGLLGEAYNITFEMGLLETAGHNVPRGATVTMEFPRGWDFGPSKRAYVESHPEMGNGEYWHEWKWNGHVGHGWTVSAKLKDPFKAGEVPLKMSGNFRNLVDSAYPHFSPIQVEMGKGVQGQMTVLVDVPQLIDVGSFRHAAYLSSSKPLISGEDAIWGMSFANMGAPSEEYLLGKLDGGDHLPVGELLITKVELRQPQGMRLFEDVGHVSGWVDGSWQNEGRGHYIWTPNSPAGAKVGEGKAAYLAFNLTGGPTKDNHFRNHDYQNLQFHFSPFNTTGAKPATDWNYSQRAWTLGGEWVYRQHVPPYESADGFQFGWPDIASAYWFGAEAQQQRRVSIGEASYGVSALGALSQLAGDYQGSHVYSRSHITDQEGDPKRSFELGDRVHIKNDFQATFASISALRAGSNLDISDVSIKTSVYTPEKAWTGKPTQVFEEAAGLVETLGQFNWMFPIDITENGVQDLIVVNEDGLIYALDGRDGSKLWVIDDARSVKQAILSDVTGDGFPEIVYVTDLLAVRVFDARLNVATDARFLWQVTHNLQLDLTSLPPWTPTALVDLTAGSGTPGKPAIALAISSGAGSSVVSLIAGAGKSGAWTGMPVAQYKSHDPLTATGIRINDLAHVVRMEGGVARDYVAVASTNKTVTLLDTVSLKPVWITQMPHRPGDLHTVDVEGDGSMDLIVNTVVSTLKAPSVAPMRSQGGTEVYFLSGETGRLAAQVRSLGLADSYQPYDAAALPSGAVVVVGSRAEVFQDATGMYDPQVVRPRQTCSPSSSGLVSSPEQRQWIAVHASDDGRAYLMDTRGAILRSTGSCPDGRLSWEVVDVGEDTAAKRYAGVHAYKLGTAQEELHRFTSYGILERRTAPGVWATVTNFCGQGVPTCGSIVGGVPMWVVDWSVEEAADGRGVRFWASALLPENAVPTQVHSFDGAAWRQEFTLTDWYPRSLVVAPDGSAAAVGTGDEGLPRAIYRAAGESTWHEEWVFYSNASFEYQTPLLDVVFDPEGTAWAIDSLGHPWRRDVSGVWVPSPAFGFSGSVERAILVVDPDGATWAFGDRFEHFPLQTRVSSATAYAKGVVDLTGLTSPDLLIVSSSELHEKGGLLLVGDESLTAIEWYMQAPGSGGWQQLTRGDPLLPGPQDVWYTRAVDCNTIDCAKIELKAVLRNLEQRSTGSVMKQDQGVTPTLKGAEVLVQAQDGMGLPGFLGLAPIQFDAGKSDATYSALRGGHVLPTDRPGWAMRSMPNDNYLSSDDLVRKIAVSETSMVGGDGPNLGVVELGWEHTRWWVLDAATGAPVAPTDPMKGYRPWAGDFIDQLLVGDFTGSGSPDLVMVGTFSKPQIDPNAPPLPGDDELQMVLIWDALEDAWDWIPEQDDWITSAAALTGPHRGRQTVTFAQYLWYDNVIGQLSNVGETRLISIYGPSGSTPAETRWATEPKQSQGLTTFTYHIPRSAMFGTSVVVSELVFDVHLAGGVTVTQTARLMDWFDILPPGQKRATPPIYNVEVVAWFPGG